MVFSFEDMWGSYLRMLKDHGFAHTVLFTTFLVVYVGFVALHPRKSRDSSFPLDVGLLAGMLLLAFGCATGSAILCQVITNGILVTFMISHLIRGIHNESRHQVLSAAFNLCVLAFLRYIDLLGDYMGAAILFALEGLLLVAISKALKTSDSISEKGDL
jgi:hypothetical protein